MSGYIYFIKRVGCGQYVKIGYATDVRKPILQFIENTVKFGINLALAPEKVANLKRDWSSNDRSGDFKIKRKKVGRFRTRSYLVYEKQKANSHGVL